MTTKVRAYVSPAYSKGRVDKAGRRIGTDHEQPDDLEILENWRASHANILNTFKTILYNRARNFDVQIAQRLKRKPTILDKLLREPGMHLSRMHDIAGCRVIFRSLDELYQFRKLMHDGRFEHERRGVDDDRWNYVESPKPSGYRGIHDVYRYHVTPKVRKAREEQPWNGMLVEIQYRTHVQHAWATAVELVGLVTASDPKFDRGNPDFIEFFRFASEILARTQEGMTSCYDYFSDEELVKNFHDLENRTHVMRLLSEIRRSEGEIQLSNASILIFSYQQELFPEDRLEIRQFESLNAAITAYNRLEKELFGQADIVLVGSRSGESIKSAYRNYFSDATEFLELIKVGLNELEDSIEVDQTELAYAALDFWHQIQDEGQS